LLTESLNAFTPRAPTFEHIAGSDLSGEDPMSYDEEQQRRSRVVVETPNARREVVQRETTRYPAPERRGHSTGMLAVVAMVAIVATAAFVFFLMNSRDGSSDTSVNVRSATQPTPLAPQQPPVVIQQPTPLTQQPPVIIQQPPPVTTQPPVVITQPPPVTSAPPPGTTTTTTTAKPPAAAPSASGGADDLTLEANVNKAFTEDPEVSVADVDVRVINGKVLLMGTVKSPELKARAEKVAYQVKGVRSVENKIAVQP
jgi:hypothetical protein